jgi:acetylornithine deacetylase/succinyl-diaminopimelate desuccinylase-like protein
MKRSGVLLAAALLLLVAAMGLKGRMLQLPGSAPASASGFSADRAHGRLAYILGDQRPHPVDSGENDAVRARLIEQMRSVGLDPQVTDDFACNSHPAVPGVSCARVRNVVATLGPTQGRHVLAVAHYDSTPVGPGAADDGIGVATLLEVADRLRGKTLRRRVTFLINEGEEAGLIGARAFTERHPIAGRVEALVNLEARGVEGPDP